MSSTDLLYARQSGALAAHNYCNYTSTSLLKTCFVPVCNVFRLASTSIWQPHMIGFLALFNSLQVLALAKLGPFREPSKVLGV